MNVVASGVPVGWGARVREARLDIAARCGDQRVKGVEIGRIRRDRAEGLQHGDEATPEGFSNNAGTLGGISGGRMSW